MVTDCKSLYDALARSESQGLGLSEKRTAIEVTATRQQMEATSIECKWVNSDRQLADSLAKPMSAHAMRELCSNGHWKIIIDQNFVAAKKVKRAVRDADFKDRNEDTALKKTSKKSFVNSFRKSIAQKAAGRQEKIDTILAKGKRDDW